MKRRIGKTEVEVEAVGLGGMPLSIQGRPAEKEAKAVICAALDSGTDFIDTADAYCLDDNDIGHNERLIRDVLKERSLGHKIKVATKGGCIRPRGDWGVDGRPEHLRRACHASLKNLGADVIFLYQFHAPDAGVPFEKSVEALAKLQQEQKILHVGLSNVSASQLRAAQRIVRVESVQNRCNPTRQQDLRNCFLQLCKEQDVTYIPYSPVGGTYGHQSLVKQETFSRLAKKHQTSPYCVILSWLLGKGDHVLPIPGAKRIASATDSPKAARLSLDEDDQAAIDALGA
jgi:aryl-alcohol dehydrogenase-like predicted oxidoreductase